jgi:hypothetical protein
MQQGFACLEEIMSHIKIPGTYLFSKQMLPQLTYKLEIVDKVPCTHQTYQKRKHSCCKR